MECQSISYDEWRSTLIYLNNKTIWISSTWWILFFSLLHCYWYDFCSRLFDRLDWCSGNKKKTHFCLESFFNDFNTFSDFLFIIFFFLFNINFSFFLCWRWKWTTKNRREKNSQCNKYWNMFRMNTNSKIHFKVVDLVDLHGFILFPFKLILFLRRCSFAILHIIIQNDNTKNIN